MSASHHRRILEVVASETSFEPIALREAPGRGGHPLQATGRPVGEGGESPFVKRRDVPPALNPGYRRR
jgi:hypothetical protein